MKIFPKIRHYSVQKNSNQNDKSSSFGNLDNNNSLSREQIKIKIWSFIYQIIYIALEDELWFEGKRYGYMVEMNKRIYPRDKTR